MFVIHIIATTTNEASRQWFDCAWQMHQRLCGSFYAYAAANGRIYDSDGTNIGGWWEAIGKSVEVSTEDAPE